MEYPTSLKGWDIVPHSSRCIVSHELTIKSQVVLVIQVSMSGGGGRAFSPNVQGGYKASEHIITSKSNGTLYLYLCF